MAEFGESPISPAKDMFSTLPNELLEFIAGNLCARENFKSFRLTSRRFSQVEAAAAEIFRTIQVTLTPEKLQDLAKISEHKHLRRHVHRLIFLPPFFRAKTHQPASENEQSEVRDAATILKSGTHEWYYQQQHELLESGEARELLSQAIASLPRLKYINLDKEDGLLPVNYPGKPAHTWKEDASQQYMKHVLQAMASSGSRILHLELNGCGPGDALSELSDAEASDLYKVLSFLQKLQLWLDRDGSPKKWKTWFDKSHLKTVLQVVTDLTDLELMGFDATETPDVGRVLETVTLPRLSNLELCCVSIKSYSLKSFLEAHCSTLKNVHLLGVYLQPWGWTDIIGILRWKCTLKTFSYGEACGLEGFAAEVFSELDMDDDPRLDKFDEEVSSYILGGPWTPKMARAFGPEPAEPIS